MITLTTDPIHFAYRVFWVNQPACVVVQDEPLDAIRSGEVVKVYRRDITALSDSNVILDDGSSLRTDLLIYATGYRIAPTMFSPSDAAHLGLPVPVSQVPPAEGEKWSRLEAKADEEVCRLFPRLSTPPTPPTHPPQRLLPPIRGGDEGELTPYRLYRSILPLSLLEADDRSFAVVGAIAVTSTGIVSEAVALWAVAWLTGQLDVKGKKAVEEVEREIAVVNAFKARRYLQHGRRVPAATYEWLSVRLCRFIPVAPTTLIFGFGFGFGIGIEFGITDRADSWWMTCWWSWV